MKRKFLRHMCMFALLILLGMGCVSYQPVSAQENAADVEEGVDVLAYGPIHEAFAETVSFDPEAGIVVSKAPPEAINEIPPEEKPEGDVEWIPGYWAWDDDRSDFIWVSGIWRAVPPDMQWIPGYWVRSGEGFQWISGYWAPEKENETVYLPEPPESVEAGPNIIAPSEDYTWIPGCWIWHYGQYAWRPGYWAPMRTDWIWVPAHYVWTPRGYIFVGGYWDYTVEYRGVLFAPVFFGIGFNLVHGYYFTPSFVIDLRVFSDCLFWRPSYNHYYFGDYYDARHYRRGIFPWFSPHARRHGYDPIYAHQRWKHRKDPNWEKILHSTFQERRIYKEARPPRALYEPGKPHQKPMVSKPSEYTLKEPFIPVKKSRESISKYKPLSKNERMKIQQRGKQVRSLSDERLKQESSGLPPSATSSGKSEAERVNLPKSPISSKPERQRSTRTAPPVRYSEPQTNPTVEPLQRRSYGVSGSSSKTETRSTTQPKSRSGSQPGGQTTTKTSPSGRYSAPQKPAVQQPQSRVSGVGKSDTGTKSEGRGQRR